MFKWRHSVVTLTIALALIAIAADALHGQGLIRATGDLCIVD